MTDEVVKERVHNFLKNLQDVRSGKKPALKKTKSIREKNQLVKPSVKTLHQEMIEAIVENEKARQGRFRKILKQNITTLLKDEVWETGTLVEDGMTLADEVANEIDYEFFGRYNFVPDAYKIICDFKNKSIDVHIWEVENGHKLPLHKIQHYFWMLDYIAGEIHVAEGSEKDIINNLYIHVLGCKQLSRDD